MFSKIRHQGCFRNSCPGWCPLVTDLVRINLSGKADGKALENLDRHFRSLISEYAVTEGMTRKTIMEKN